MSLRIMQRGWHWADQAQLSYWDSLIVAAAEWAGCGWLLSEDFQAGRRFGPKAYTKKESLDFYRSATAAAKRTFIYLSAGVVWYGVVGNEQFTEWLE